MTTTLWTCPRCGRTFANRNQTHTCAPLGALDAHFARSDPAVRACFDRVLDELGPLDVLAEKSRIALHVRMSFAAFQPRQHWLDGHLVLARRAEHPSIRRIQEYSPRNIVHEFRLVRPDEIDAEFVALLHEAYDVGLQRHLPARRPGSGS
ncbi:MAG: DUF5655 domain-containing protein [Microbacterium sp.]